MQIFLPEERYCAWNFLFGILQNQKKTFKRNEIQHIHLKRYNELQATNILKLIGTDEKVASYLPDKTQESYGVDEAFVLAFINTIYPEYI